MIKSIADRFFRWYCHPDYYPDIKGDLEELHTRLQEKNKYLAQLGYFYEVILLFRPALIKPLNNNFTLNNDLGMLKNYFKIAYRNLVRQKAYTFINVLGLAVGLAAFIVINQYIRFERSYDNFFSKSKEIYRLTTDQRKDGVVGIRDAMSFHPSGKALKEDLPEVQNYTTTFKFFELVFRHYDNVRFERKIVAADSNYFKLFDYKLLRGERETALNEPYSIILTEQKARDYFGNEDPMGKTMHILSRFNRDFKVTGIMEDVPENTHYKYDMLLSLKSIQQQLDDDDWNGFNYYTYVQLQPQNSRTDIEDKLNEASKKYLGDETTLFFNLQPVETIHLHSDLTFEPEIHGSAQSVNFMVVISIFILIIAWVNYINLSTARAIDRAKEVGLRKVIGARKKQLMLQFLFESAMVNFISALLALLLAEMALPFFNDLVGKSIAPSFWNQNYTLIIILAFFSIGTFFTGFYPALVLSGFNPVSVLKGKFRNSKQGTRLREGLVVLQFAVSLILISGTLIVVQQLNHMRSQDLGFDVEGTVAFTNEQVAFDDIDEHIIKIRSFHNALKSHEAIISVGATSATPGGGTNEIGSSAGGVKIVGKTDILSGTNYVQHNSPGLFETLGINLITGRDFRYDLASDTAAVIVNQSFLNRFSITDYEGILNEKIQLGRNPENPKYHVIGVVNDFNRTSLKRSIEPTCYFSRQFAFNNTVAKIDVSRYQDGMTHLQDTWSQFFPNTPLDLKFIDDRFERLYMDDERFGTVFASFSMMAIFVSLLGLFGLASFMAVQRTKEVGVRKVLGASVQQIIGLFYREFFILVGIASVIGFPLIFFIMNGWLDNYAYRISFPWLVLILSSLLIIVLTMLTVGLQVYRVAIVNPSRTLRYE